jgi:hypothetical protein
VITPFNIFVRGGGGLLIPYEDKLMWLPHSTWVDTGGDDDDDEEEEEDDDDCKDGATSGLDGTCINDEFSSIYMLYDSCFTNIGMAGFNSQPWYGVIGYSGCWGSQWIHRLENQL